MGIYREIKITDEEGRPASLEYAMGKTVIVHVSEPGLEFTARLKPEDWTEKRTACFCCSCGESVGSDPACRNHGFAATRPCEVHGTSGSTWDEEMSPELKGVMPESVQQSRLDGQRWLPTSSSNTDVAKVLDGNVIAVGSGLTTITYLSESGEERNSAVTVA